MQVEDVAEIPTPIDDDGVRTVSIGTALFGVAAAVTPFVADAEVAWTCLSGFLLGLVGITYCVRRRNAIARDAEAAGAAG
jgi:hypothetical protein